MPNNGAEERSGREIRLLVLVIAVAVAVLLILARFRFPSVDLAATPPSPGPLERLAARATFDDLSSILTDATARITPAFAVVQIEHIPEKPERKGAPPQAADANTQHWIAALRVRPDMLLAYVPTGMRIAAVEGAIAAPQMLVADVRRELALIRVGPGPGVPIDFSTAVTDFGGGTFVIVVEGALGGPAVRPAFVPRVDALADNRWNGALFAIGGQPQPGEGGFLFTVEGRLIGLAIRHAAGLAIVPAQVLDDPVTELTSAGAGGGE